MNHAEKEPDMVLKLFQTLRFSFGLAVAYAYERHDRRHIHYSQCIRISRRYLTEGDQGPKDIRVIVLYPFHIPF